MSSMMNHKKRSHRSEKVHRSGVMGMRRYAPRSAMPFTYDMTANMSHYCQEYGHQAGDRGEVDPGEWAGGSGAENGGRSRKPGGRAATGGGKAEAPGVGNAESEKRSEEEPEGKSE